MNEETAAKEVRELFTNSTWITMSRLVRAASVVAQSVVLARALGIRNYGNYAVVVALVGPIQELLNPNLGAAIVRYGTNYIEDNDRDDLIALIQLSYVVGMVCVLLVVAASLLAVAVSYRYLFEAPYLKSCILAYAAASSLAIIDGNSFALLRLFNRFRINAIVEALAAITSFIVIVVACRWYADSVSSMIYVVALTIVCSSLLVNAIGFWELRESLAGIWRINIRHLKKQFHQTARFVFGNSLALTFERTTRRCDVLLLAFLSTGASVALYDVARKISSLILLLRDPIAMAVFPQVSRLVAKKEYQSLTNLLWQSYRILIVPLVGFLLVICVWGNQLAGVWGAEFVTSSWVVQFLSLRAMLFLVFFWNMSLILSLGKVRFQLFASIASALVGFCIAVPLTVRFGATGMAFSMFIATLLAQLSYAYVGLNSTRTVQSSQSREAMTV